VDFPGCYNAILGRPYYVKSMVVPNCTYLKLKMLDLCGIIIATASFKASYTCELASFKLVPTHVKSPGGDSPVAIDVTTTVPDAARPKEQGGQETTPDIANVLKCTRVSR
jgi:hypothetical protein